MKEKLKQIIDRFKELESLLADPKIISDNDKLKEIKALMSAKDRMINITTVKNK